MNISIESAGRTLDSANVPATEKGVWDFVGQHLKDAIIPSVWDIKAENNGSAHISIKARGTYDKDGQRVPSMFLTIDYNTINVVSSLSEMEERYLTCINPGSNNYKFYRFIPEVNGVMAEYGRIGAQAGDLYAPKRLQAPMDVPTAILRYYEKQTKGYVDKTDIFVKSAKAGSKPVRTAKKTAKTASVAATPAQKLFEELRRASRGYVEQRLVNVDVTEKQVKEARAIWKEMAARKTVKGFNKQLLDLMTLSPRKTQFVTQEMARDTNDFGLIVDREEKLILAMEGLTGVTDNDSSDDFLSHGIEVYEARPEQRSHVLDKLSDSYSAGIRNKVVEVYRIIPKAQKAKFSKYLKDNNIHHGTGQIREFWHGSGNENWLSIVLNSLSLHPNAKICGKMLGNGLYFAPSASKSWGYTSATGSRWAKGNSSTAYMGLYATAYGDPLMIGGANPLRAYTASEVKAKGKTCVFAPKGAGGWLKAAEMCFYDEAAVCLNYLVKFRA